MYNLELEKVLKSKKCFKLVCGAGNEDADEVEKLVYLYSRAGCNIFDVSANLDVIRAAKSGIKRAGIEKERFICVSIGIKGDPHARKAKIDENICQKCGLCEEVCPQGAIKSFQIEQKRCIGCQKCASACEIGALKFFDSPKDLEKIMPEIIHEGVDCLEFHAIGADENEVDQKWNFLNSIYDGILSVCVDRSKLSNEALIARLKRLLKVRQGKGTIIQADGSPMSGGKDDYNTTLQAVATAEIVQKNNLDAFILLSGGTNSKSKELANLCGVEVNGVAIGSYARKIVKDYLCDKMNINEALLIAGNLVNSAH